MYLGRMSRLVLSLVVLGLPGSAALPAGNAGKMPTEAVENIRARLPVAAILSETPCPLGGARAQSYGVLVEVHEPAEERSHPLRAR